VGGGGGQGESCAGATARTGPGEGLLLQASLSKKREEGKRGRTDDEQQLLREDNVVLPRRGDQRLCGVAIRGS
jgi:hypothetical protein